MYDLQLLQKGGSGEAGPGGWVVRAWREEEQPVLECP